MKGTPFLTLPVPPRLAEVYLVASDTMMGACHEFPSPKPLKRDEATEYYRLGIETAHQEYPDFAAGKAYLLKAINYCPDYVDAIVALGNIELNPSNPARDVVAARAAYELALSLDEDSATAGLGRLAVLIDEGRFDDAETAYRDLLIRQPRFMRYSTVERYEAEARPAFGWFYARKRDLQTLKRLGDAYFTARRYVEAGERYHSVLGNDSRDIETRLALAFAHFRAHESDRAEVVLRDIIDNPSRIESASACYRIWLFQDQIVPPQALGHGVSPVGPRMTALNQLGVIYLGRGLPHEALQFFQEAGCSDVEENNAGVVALVTGHIDQALESFARSDCPQAAYNLALIHEMQEHWMDAAAAWELFLSRFNTGRAQDPLKKSRRYVDTFDPGWQEEGAQRLAVCLGKT